MSCNCNTPKNLDPSGAVTCQGPAGPRGQKGDKGNTGANGAPGLSSVGNTTADFVTPAVNTSVDIALSNAAWIAPGQILYIQGAGFYQAAQVAANVVTVINLGYGPNAAPATNVASGAIVTAGGPKGDNQPENTKGVILLKRVLAQGQAGGTFTAGAWRARKLNVIETDSKGLVISLDATTGIFKLKAGKYRVRGEIPAYGVDRHRARLRNITTGGSKNGTSEFANAGFQSSSMIVGFLDLAVDTELVVESRGQTTIATNGFGVPSNFPGLSEEYEWVSIEEA